MVLAEETINNIMDKKLDIEGECLVVCWMLFRFWICSLFMQKYVPKKIIKIIPKLLKPPDICQLILWFLQWNQIQVNLLSFYVILKFEYLTFGLVKHNKHAG